MRVLSRVLAAVLAVALVALGVLAIIEIVLAASGRDPWIVPHDEWNRDARTTLWRDDSIVIIGVILGLVGLALLVTQLLPRRPASWPVAVPDASNTTADVGRGTVEQAVAQAASSVDGIQRARAHGTRKGLVVEARTGRVTDDTVRAGVHDAVTQALNSLHLQPPPNVDVRVRRTR